MSLLPEGVIYRLATADDNDLIEKFLVSHGMNAGMNLRFDRQPNFFSLLQAHSTQHETHLLLKNNVIVGLASLVVRPGFVRGNVEQVAYVGDLRLTHDRQLAGKWRRLFLERVQQLAKEQGVSHAYCAIIRDNHRARNALISRRDLGFKRFSGYNTVSLLGMKPQFMRPRPFHTQKIRIRNATDDDFSDVQALLLSAAQKQPFGVVFDAETLAKRLEQWPEFSMGNFYLAFNESKELVACMASWDYSTYKRLVFDAWPSGTGVVRTVYNLLSGWLHRPKLNRAPNAVLPDVALTHMAIRQTDTDVFAALLNACVSDLFKTGRYATVSLCLFDGSPLWSTLKNYWYHATPMDLYSMSLGSNSSFTQAQFDDVPGFEFYLV